LVATGIRDPDPYRDTGKTCFGRDMHCLSASSYLSEEEVNDERGIYCQ